MKLLVCALMAAGALVGCAADVEAPDSTRCSSGLTEGPNGTCVLIRSGQPPLATEYREPGTPAP